MALGKIQMGRLKRNFGNLENLYEDLDEVVEFMKSHDIPVTRNCVHNLLQVCEKKKNLECGRRVHFLMMSNGLHSCAILADYIIRLFTHHGSLVEANQAFCKVAKPTVYTWSAILSANAKLEQGKHALELFNMMQLTGVANDKYVYIAILTSCIMTSSLQQGRLIHDRIITGGLLSDIILGNNIILMYTRCGSLAEASATLCKLPSLSVVSWNIMIGGYASCGVHVAALNLFEKMQQEGTRPTRATFLGMLEACKSKEAVREGRYIHCHVMESTLRFDQAVGNAITVMYIMCGSFKEGFGQFWALLDRDVVSWSTIIAGCVQYDEGLLALEYFQDMQQQGIVSNNIIFSSILKACASIRATGQGRLIHSQIIQCGTRLDDIVGNVLVDMYAKCESLMEACRAFDNLSVRDVISWGSIIGGYVEQGECRIALKYFSDMLRGGIKPNNAAFSCALRACANIGAIYEGRFIHEKVMITGLQMDDILQNSFVIMYAKCGYLEEAQKFFNRIPNPDVSLWGAMIAEYAHYGEGFAALKCFDGMIQRCIKPDEILFSSILVACSRAGLLDEGWWYYKSMVGHYGIPSTTFHSSCMIDLLCRAGHINEVKMLLQNTVHLNILGWTSLLGVCRMHSNVKIGKHCFDKVISFDPQSAACYVLMSNIYAEAHMHQNACRI